MTESIEKERAVKEKQGRRAMLESEGSLKMMRTRQTVIEQRLIAQKKNSKDLNWKVEKKEEELATKERRLAVLEGIQTGGKVSKHEHALQASQRAMQFQGRMQAAKRQAKSVTHAVR